MDMEQKARFDARDRATYRSMAAERKDELLERRMAVYALKKNKMKESVGASIPACASSSAANNAGWSWPRIATMSWNSVRWSRFPAIQEGSVTHPTLSCYPSGNCKAMTNHITKVVQSLNNSRIRKIACQWSYLLGAGATFKQVYQSILWYRRGPTLLRLQQMTR